MKFSIKIALLIAILVADLSFFLFLRTYSPEGYERIFQMMPWSDTLEKTVAVIAGLVIALVVSFFIVHIMVNRILDSL
jgi:hypothetical protein